VPSQISSFIRHWEPAHFNRDAFEQAHRVHEVGRRRKREINYNHNSPHYGTANIIKFNFKAHDRYNSLSITLCRHKILFSFSFNFHRDFHIELREDPSSVFASDMVIENTNGPLDYDISRVYSGKLEGEFEGHNHDCEKSLMNKIKIETHIILQLE
jgi:disintegrin and metalloproteinase domain-containing protein 10